MSRAQSVRDAASPTASQQGGVDRVSQDDPRATGSGSANNESVHEAWKNQYLNRQATSANDLVGLMEEGELQEESNLENDDDNDGFLDIDNTDYNEISVPLTIILSVIAGYIFFGTILFGFWEGWDPLVAAYFCFITISTIGFGDIVPGFANGSLSSGSQYEMLGTALYMLFGMATLSMCFTLVQDQMVVKFRLLAKKMGAVKCRKKNAEDGDDSSSRTSSSEANESATGGSVNSPGDPFVVSNETRRKRRVARLKFNWVQKRLSRKGKNANHKRTTEVHRQGDGAHEPQTHNAVDKTVKRSSVSAANLAPLSNGWGLINNGYTHNGRSLSKGVVAAGESSSVRALPLNGVKRTSSIRLRERFKAIQERPLPDIGDTVQEKL